MRPLLTLVFLVLLVPLVLIACGPSVDFSIVEADRLAQIESWAVVLRHPQTAALDDGEPTEPGQVAPDTDYKASVGETNAVEGGVTPGHMYPGPVGHEPAPLLQPMIDRIEFELIAEHGIKIVDETEADGLIQLSTDIREQRYDPRIGLVGGRITTVFVRLVDLDGVILAVLKVEADAQEHNAKVLAETAAKRIAETLRQL